MDELNTVVPASSHPKHVQLLNEQVHIDDVGDFVILDRAQNFQLLFIIPSAKIKKKQKTEQHYKN